MGIPGPEGMEVQMSIDSFRDLRVWQVGMDLAERVYELTKLFPRHEIYGLAGQAQRAATSVPSNIAEGHARESTKEYLHHVSIAQGSVAELQTQLELVKRLHYISGDQLALAVDVATSLAKQLHALRNALQKRLSCPQPPTPNS